MLQAELTTRNIHTERCGYYCGFLGASNKECFIFSVGAPKIERAETSLQAILSPSAAESAAQRRTAAGVSLGIGPDIIDGTSGHLVAAARNLLHAGDVVEQKSADAVRQADMQRLDAARRMIWRLGLQLRSNETQPGGSQRLDLDIKTHGHAPVQRAALHILAAIGMLRRDKVWNRMHFDALSTLVDATRRLQPELIHLPEQRATPARNETACISHALQPIAEHFEDAIAHLMYAQFSLPKHRRYRASALIDIRKTLKNSYQCLGHDAQIADLELHDEIALTNPRRKREDFLVDGFLKAGRDNLIDGISALIRLQVAAPTIGARAMLGSYITAATSSLGKLLDADRHEMQRPEPYRAHWLVQGLLPWLYCY